VVQHNINKEMCTVDIVFPLFCPTAVFQSFGSGFSVEDNRKIYNKNCYNACTGLKLRQKRKWKIKTTSQINTNA
jgi:hypothetical protein